MVLKRETICEDTLEFVQEYYRLNMEPLFFVLADDCVWMGTGNVLASGAAAIRGFFKDGLSCRLSTWRSRTSGWWKPGARGS